MRLRAYDCQRYLILGRFPITKAFETRIIRVTRFVSPPRPAQFYPPGRKRTFRKLSNILRSSGVGPNAPAIRLNERQQTDSKVFARTRVLKNRR